MSTPNKDWRNFEKRREEALRAGYTSSPYGVPRPRNSVGESTFGQSLQGQGRSNLAFEYDYAANHNKSIYGSKRDPYDYDVHGQVVPYGVPQTQANTAFSTYGVVQDQLQEDEYEGPLQKRKCRDVICLGLFAAFLVLMACVAGYALWTGSYTRVSQFQFDICDKDEMNFEVHSVKANYSNPNEIEASNGTSDWESLDIVDDIAVTFKEYWHYLIYMALMALGIAIVMTIILRFFAAVVIWGAIIIIVILAVGATITTWVLWSKAEEAAKTGMLTLAIIVTFITLIYLLALIGMRKRIALVVQLFKEAGKAVHAMPLLMLQPVYTFLAQGLVTAAFMSLAVLIETTRVKNSDGKCVKPALATYSRYLNVFAYFWMIQFVIGCQHLIVAGVVVRWFFTRNKSSLGFPIMASVKNLLRYHLGSVAFGSILVAIVKFIRWVIRKLTDMLFRVPYCQCIACCCQCFLWCVENWLEFLNRNAYIEIAIYGYAFCPSAKRAFKVITSNALRIIAINSVGDFVLFLAKLSIAALTGVCGYYLFDGTINKTGDESLDAEWALIVLGVFFSYFVATCFISIYEMAIDTIFVCFCEDLEMNDGMSRPYFMSKGLMKFVKENDRLEKKHQKKNKKSKD